MRKNIKNNQDEETVVVEHHILLPHSQDTATRCPNSRIYLIATHRHVHKTNTDATTDGHTDTDSGKGRNTTTELHTNFPKLPKIFYVVL